MKLVLSNDSTKDEIFFPSREVFTVLPCPLPVFTVAWRCRCFQKCTVSLFPGKCVAAQKKRHVRLHVLK